MLPKYPPELKEQIIIYKSQKVNILIPHFSMGSHYSPTIRTYFKQNIYIIGYSRKTCISSFLNQWGFLLRNIQYST